MPKTALITGASSGIGLELARLFARDKFDLALVARDEKKLTEIAKQLEQTHGVVVQVIALDLSEPSAPFELFKKTESLGLRIDALVNKAGFGI